ncbi:MAG: DUF3187 family protein [Halioglobus sp.]|nr:DUF3187 family protein [Halioglobus sp.]
MDNIRVNTMLNRLLLASLAVSPAHSALAASSANTGELLHSSEPLYVKNLSPVAGLFGLPSQRSALTTPVGTLSAALHGSIASHYINDSNPGELINLDGETRRVALELRYGVAENWDLQLELPWLDHSGGDLDELIDDWHDLWGMADGGRSDIPRDLLDYRYATPQGGIALQDDASGVGDISLSLSHAFYREDGATASVALGYKSGTGDEQDFTGSGSDDVFVALRFSAEHLSDLPLVWHAQAGYLRAGRADSLAEFQQRDLWFAGLGMHWRFARRWSAIVQVDSHAAPLDSDLTATGDTAFLLAVGARWQFAEHWQLDLSVVEDIGVETAPDVVFQASIRLL